MRKALVEALCEIAEKDKRVFVITGDLGYRVLESFQEKFPERFLNIGVAEANLVTVAAGLATMGFIPFIYSIANFAAIRPFEQIRNDVCLQNLNVKIIGIGGGLAYAKAGSTHHSLEDIALMRLLPNMTIVAPADPNETYVATKAIYMHRGPIYLRCERNPKSNIYEKVPDFKLGKAKEVKKGKKIALLATGAKVETAQAVAVILKKHNLDVAIYAFPTIKPLDRKVLSKISREVKLVITIEEHRIDGGFGSAVLEYFSEISSEVKVKRFGIGDEFAGVSAEYDKLIYLYKLTPEQIAKSVIKLVNKPS